MNQPLIWRFELDTTKPLQIDGFPVVEKENIKWESRLFWPENQLITLYALDDLMTNINNYDQKQKDDYYYLQPDSDDNIKRRNHELFYKPLITQTPYAQGFGEKIKMHAQDSVLKEAATIIHVKKTGHLYLFNTRPHIKLELAKIQVLNDVYFTACVEGRSRYLVEMISEHLMGRQLSCDYIHFLKNIVQS